MTAADLLRRPLADKFLYQVLVRLNAYKCAKFQLPISISCRENEVSQNLMWGYYPPAYPVRWNFYVCSKYLARSNRAQNFSIVSLCIMQLCEYFPYAFHYKMWPKMFFFWGGLRVKMWKYCLLTPKRREYASVDVSRDKIGSAAWALGWKMLRTKK